MKLTLPFDLGDDELKDPATLSARDWQLFNAETDAMAAQELSAAVVSAMAAQTRADADRIAWAVMDKWAHVGASDTEPRNLMMAYLDSVFGVQPPAPLRADEQAVLDKWVDEVFGSFLRNVPPGR